MPTKTLASLVLDLLNDFARLQELQVLLKIGLTEADSPSKEACSRIALLVDTYLCQSEPWLQNVEMDLQRLREQLYPLIADD